MDRVEKALIRAELEQLNAEFAYLIDHDKSEQVADLFTEKGSYGRSSGERSTGRAAIRAAYAVRAQRGTRTARHIFTNLRLAYDGLDRVRGTTLLILFAEDGPPPHRAEPNLVSEYEDIYERGPDDVWRYASRLVTPLFLHPDSKPLVLPLGKTGA
ncbi:nuclear transport factor 2 family protein [Caballeronia sp. DA-9]|uniref:nuclear transport factor 2 family protein n=1 Tax=Caballeronia sp. DA-9 TaxID=3436237 RepID=UPI003F675181